MIKLIQNEWMKIRKRSSTWIMVVTLLIIVSLYAAFSVYQEGGIQVPDNENWIYGLQLENSTFQDELENTALSKDKKEYLQKQINMNNYRIDHDISTNTNYSVWSFLSDSTNLIILAGLFTIIIAGGIVANEFSWGTVKLLLIRPISRSKILLSKYITILLFNSIFLLVLFCYSFLLGVILFGMPENSYPYLDYKNGSVVEVSMLFFTIKYFVFKSIPIFMLATMAFMISTVFRNSSLAIGVSLFLMFVGNTVTNILANWFEWSKYLLFANTDLTRYIDGVPLIEGMTLSFSVLILIIYYLVFMSISFLLFQKRDVST